MHAYRAVLRDRTARSLFWSQTVSSLGDWLGLATLVVIAYQRSGSVLGSSALFAVQGAAALTATIAVGPHLDLVDRRRGLVGAYVLGAAVLLLPVVAGGLWPVLVAVAVTGALRPLAASLRNAVIGTDLPDGLIGPSVALQTSVSQATATVGLLTGGAVVVMVGAVPGLIADALTFVLAALLVRAIPHGRGESEERPRILDGVRAWAGNRTARAAMVVLVGGSLVGALPEALAPAFAGGSGWLPLVLASQSAGTAVGGLLVGARPAWEHPRRIAVLVAVSAVVMVATGLGAGISPAVVAAGNFLFGMAFAFTVLAQTVFTRAVDSRRIGAAVSSAITVVMVTEGFGALLLGGIATASTPGVAYVVAASIPAVAAAVALRGASRPRAGTAQPVEARQA